MMPAIYYPVEFLRKGDTVGIYSDSGQLEIWVAIDNAYLVSNETEKEWRCEMSWVNCTVTDPDLADPIIYYTFTDTLTQKIPIMLLAKGITA